MSTKLVKIRGKGTDVYYVNPNLVCHIKINPQYNSIRISFGDTSNTITIDDQDYTLLELARLLGFEMDEGPPDDF